MAKPKLSYDVEADRQTAISDYIRKNAGNIEFLRFPHEIIRVAKVEIGSLKKPMDLNVSYTVTGNISIEYRISGGNMTKLYPFACDCKISRGDDDEPVVSNLATIRVRLS